MPKTKLPFRLQPSAHIVSVDARALQVPQHPDVVRRKLGREAPALDDFSPRRAHHLAVLRLVQQRVERPLRAGVVARHLCASVLLHADASAERGPFALREGHFVRLPGAGPDVDVTVGQEGRLCVHSDVFHKDILVHDFFCLFKMKIYRVNFRHGLHGLVTDFFCHAERSEASPSA